MLDDQAPVTVTLSYDEKGETKGLSIAQKEDSPQSWRRLFTQAGKEKLFLKRPKQNAV